MIYLGEIFDPEELKHLEGGEVVEIGFSELEDGDLFDVTIKKDGIEHYLSFSSEGVWLYGNENTLSPTEERVFTVIEGGIE